MKTSTVTLLAVIGFLLFAGIIGGSVFLSSYNGLASLKNSYEMKVKSNQGEFDNLWKKIQQAAEIPEAKKKALQDVLTSYATARSTGKQQMMTWIKESVPSTAGLDIYDKLQNIITGSRDSWTMRQTELVSIAEQYNHKIVVFPSNMIAGMFGFQHIDPQVITSTRTEGTFASSKDDEVGIFKK